MVPRWERRPPQDITNSKVIESLTGMPVQSSVVGRRMPRKKGDMMQSCLRSLGTVVTAIALLSLPGLPGALGHGGGGGGGGGGGHGGGGGRGHGGVGFRGGQRGGVGPRRTG